ncbi:hypothetical protein SAMN05216215_101873 [Saccharopolyspora shandongensis]|uniref:Uncharacterized protein n=1 Tax=Saccharopolyspora shandongensis TaxID=418495 RepID=A0A1H3G9U9_9PSEU|nr:hypothetical protein [Saccharopolyspora shandongensis]SDX99109.1 hypothetical protein SAMN05216215_101873 [Saccharopolyspora shandongensis]
MHDSAKEGAVLTDESVEEFDRPEVGDVEDGNATLVEWSKARAFLNADPRASTTDLAVLDLATSLGEDRFRLTEMGRAHRRMVRAAMNAALGKAC